MIKPFYIYLVKNEIRSDLFGKQATFWLQSWSTTKREKLNYHLPVV